MGNKIKHCTFLEHCPEVPEEVLKSQFQSQFQTCVHLEHCPKIPEEVLEQCRITPEEWIRVLIDIYRRKENDNKSKFRRFIEKLFK